MLKFHKKISAVFQPKTDKTIFCDLLQGEKQFLIYLFSSSGIEDNPTIFYQLIRGSTDQTNKYDTFYLQQRQENGWTYADVKVNQPLDFERIKEYNLTIRVEVRMSKYFPNQTLKNLIVNAEIVKPRKMENRSLKPYFQNNGAQQLASEATIFIVLEDVNDEIPLFTEREQETVMEGEPIGTPVTRYENLARVFLK